MPHLSLHTEIEIEASADRIWTVLTDFDAYPEWNPLIRSISGEARQGATLRISVQSGGGKAMRFAPRVLAAEPGRELRWVGRLAIPGLFKGEHRFIIHPLSEGRVRFEQSEDFSGLLIACLRASLERDIKRGFEEMNQALKARAEGAGVDMARSPVPTGR